MVENLEFDVYVVGCFVCWTLPDVLIAGVGVLVWISGGVVGLWVSML